jgi:hypothetical protein
MISSVNSNLALAAHRRSTAAPTDFGNFSTAEAAQPQVLPSAGTGSSSNGGGLIAPTSLSALLQAQTPQGGDDALVLTGRQLPSPQIGRGLSGPGGARAHPFDSTAA